MEMIKVEKSKFNEVLDKVPHEAVYRLGEINTLRYNGKKGFFKGMCFAKQVDNDYYVDSVFTTK